MVCWVHMIVHVVGRDSECSIFATYSQNMEVQEKKIDMHSMYATLRSGICESRRGRWDMHRKRQKQGCLIMALCTWPVQKSTGVSGQED
jgi:hypothetical protein